jgi:hypothetical protein
MLADFTELLAPGEHCSDYYSELHFPVYHLSVFAFTQANLALSR